MEPHPLGRRLVAAALNLVAPGAGFVLLGQRGGWVLLAVYGALLVVSAMALRIDVLPVAVAVGLWSALAALLVG